MASSSSSSPQLEMEQSFSIAAGDLTEAEREYRLRKGLIYENSKDETLDISTDVESINSSNLSRSHLDSLLIFEENEKLYSALLDKSAASSNGSTENSPVNVQNSPMENENVNSPERQLYNMSKLSLNESSVSPGYAYPILNEQEEDKENEFKGPIGVQRVLLFQDELERVRDPLEEIKGLAEHLPMTDFEESEKSQDEGSEMSDNEVCIIPCTQEVPHEVSLPINSDDVEVVPCTQGQNESINLNQTYTSVTLEESLVHEEEEVLVPCTQAPESSFNTISDGEVSRLNESSMTSNLLPCSQSSSGEVRCKDDFNDTISYMDYLLKKADEQEEREQRAAELEKSHNPGSVSPCKKTVADDEQEPEQPISISSEVPNQQEETDNQDEVFFKTPLKHNRVQLLKNKKMASPSPPRSFANNLLKQRGAIKVPAPVVAIVAKEKKPIVRKSLTITSASSSPIGTSTPKQRVPVTNITPATKNYHTPGRGGVPKTPVVAKVDSGLRTTQFPIGLSPVAKYIYDKPVPSKFARVQSVPNPMAAATASAPNSLSRIPLPPVRSSQANKSITPASASKLPPRHSGVLRTSTYFNMTKTPPQIVANEKTVLEKKRFQPLQYTGASKVKGLNGKVDSPRTDDYVAHRHTGLRDESGNASFIQNTVIQKRNIPVQSRLATPKNEIVIQQENAGEDVIDTSSKLWTSPIRRDTFVISK